MQHDFWGKAAACAKAACTTSDLHKRELLVSLGEFWLELGRRDASEISEETALDIARIECVQAKIIGANVIPTIH
jgi:hypothetical protein